jgi:hypothetical protein
LQDLFEDVDDERDASAAETDTEVQEFEQENPMEFEASPAGACDSLILKKLRSSLAGLCRRCLQ